MSLVVAGEESRGTGGLVESGVENDQVGLTSYCPNDQVTGD